ncbi:hypothetical protein LMG33818_002482 [Halomonadaceae bacterium LMG 33818]
MQVYRTTPRMLDIFQPSGFFVEMTLCTFFSVGIYVHKKTGNEAFAPLFPALFFSTYSVRV